MIDATPALKLYAKYRMRRLAAQDPAEVQEKELLELVKKAEATRFGADHRFPAIKSVKDFQKRVPLRRYEDFWTEYWKGDFPKLTDCTWPGAVPFFAVTSGTTTGVTKYIPCTREMNRSNIRAGVDLLAHHILNRPRSTILAGKSFMLGGSTDLVEEAPGVRSGDLSGIAASELPWWARPRYFPPLDLALIADWEEKIDKLARLSLAQDIRSISGTPSWLLMFFDKLAELRPGSGRGAIGFYPDLELLVHGGVNFAPYRRRFEELLEGSHAEMREVYAASEGFIAVADRDFADGLRLILDNGLFLEFVPVDELDKPNPTRHWLANVEKDANYAVVVSTCAGAWSYIVGDTVKFIELEPPRLLVTGRTSYSLSAFGEHLIGEEIEESVTTAAEAVGAMITDYSVGALYPQKEGDLGGHLYIVEFSEPISDDAALAAFSRALDEGLSATNEDYKVHRTGGFGLNPPRVQAVKPGTFASWMKSRGQLGGQHKVPRIINEQELFQDLREFASRYQVSHVPTTRH